MLIRFGNCQLDSERDEMVEAVWEGRSVSDVTLNSRVNAARHAIGDYGKRQALIRTVLRRGFRFVGELIEGIAASGMPIEGDYLPVDKDSQPWHKVPTLEPKG